MRPTKLTPTLIRAFKKVLSNEKYLKVCTDLELCHLINKELKEEERISYRSFQRYKLMVKEYTLVITHKEKMVGQYELYHELYTLWMDARIAMKIKLMEFIESKVSGWQRYRWLLERRFQEFALDQSKFPREYSYDYALTLTDHSTINTLRYKQEREARLKQQNNNNNNQTPS